MRKKGFLWLALVTAVLISLLAALSILSCTEGTTSQGKMNVAVSILPQSEFVKAIGGEKVSVMVMVPPGLDPHTYEPKPSQMRELATAGLYVKLGSGLGFELAYLNKLIAVNKKMLISDSSRGIQLIKGADQGDYEGGTDPHIWLSPVRAKIMVQNISSGMVQLNPDNRAFYESNRDIYQGKLTQLDKDIRGGLAGVKNRRFMVLHSAWAYFARDYNLEEIAIEVGGKEPSARDMARLVDAAREYQIKVIFVSPQFSRKSADFLAREIGGKAVSIDDLAPDYLDNMRYVLSEMVKAME